MIRYKNKGVETYQFENLSSEPQLTHFVSTRNGGMSEPPYEELNFALHVGDNPLHVLENRRRLMESVNIALDSVVTCEQVHGCNVKIVTSDMRGNGAISQESAVPNTDALITGELNICLAIMAADCVPIILYDRVQNVLGLVHSGWKGTVNRIAEKTVHEMIQVFGTKPENIVAGIGPSIGPDRYVVGPEVASMARSSFTSPDIVRNVGNGTALFDLWAANCEQLLALGILASNVEVSRICVFTHSAKFFSHRRQKPTGRFVTAAMLKD